MSKQFHRAYWVCSQCISDLKDARSVFEHKLQPLLVKKDERLAKCPFRPRCFDQPGRVKRSEEELVEKPATNSGTIRDILRTIVKDRTTPFDEVVKFCGNCKTTLKEEVEESNPPSTRYEEKLVLCNLHEYRGRFNHLTKTWWVYPNDKLKEK